MTDSGRVEGIIAAMATTSDGWRLSCDLDNIRNDGKVAAAFNVGYGGLPVYPGYRRLRQRRRI